MVGNDEAGRTRTTNAAPRPAGPTVLDHVVARLRDIERRTGLERTLAIGELVLNEFFGGNPQTWRDRRRNKNNSIRRLADRVDCPFCKSALNEAVGVYVAVRGLPCVRTFGHISASHVASVLRLSWDERERMLQQAERERWSVRELRDNVISRRGAMGERRGRPPCDTEARALVVLRNSLRLMNESLVQMSGGELRPETRAELRATRGELARLGTRLLELERPGPERARDREKEPELREQSA